MKLSTILPKEPHARTRRVYIVEALLEYLVALLVTGAFLSAICKQVGVSDAVTGIVSSFISLACVAQMFSGALVRPGQSTKKILIVCAIVNQLMFATLYMIPFIHVPQAVKVTLFIVMILSAYFILNIAQPVQYKWLMTFVPMNQRGRFTANKEIVSLIGGMTFTFAMGNMVDYFKATGREQPGFILCGVTIFAVSILHLISMLLAADEPRVEPVSAGQKENRFKGAFALLGKSKALRRLLVIDILWKTAVYMSTPYYGTYLIVELGFSLTMVSIFNIIHSSSRAVVSPWFGRIADKKGWVSLLSLCLVICVAGYIAATFMNPGLRFLYVVYYALYAICMAGANSSLYNITYDYVPEEQFTNAFGARNAISGIVGFLASLLGGWIVSTVQANGNLLFGHTIYAQQLLSAIAGTIMLILLIYVRLVIARMPKKQ